MWAALIREILLNIFLYGILAPVLSYKNELTPNATCGKGDKFRSDDNCSTCICDSGAHSAIISAVRRQTVVARNSPSNVRKLDILQEKTKRMIKPRAKIHWERKREAPIEPRARATKREEKEGPILLMNFIQERTHGSLTFVFLR